MMLLAESSFELRDILTDIQCQCKQKVNPIIEGNLSRVDLNSKAIADDSATLEQAQQEQDIKSIFAHKFVSLDMKN
jgi:hypothetical protein